MRTCGVVGYPIIIDQSLIIRLVITGLGAIRTIFLRPQYFSPLPSHVVSPFLSFPFLSLLISLRLILSLPAIILLSTVLCHMSLAAAVIAFILVVFIALAGPVSFHLTNIAPSAGICLSAETRFESPWICLGVRKIGLRPYGLIAALAIKSIVSVLLLLVISLYFVFLLQYTYKGVGLNAAFQIRIIRIFGIPHIRFDKASPTLGKRV